ncbi:MAG: ABC transporter ATP-binding protein [Thermoguttaceae bacterium]
MPLSPSELPDSWQELPAAWRAEAEAELGPDETPLAWLEPDLDARLNYADGLLVLTDRRLVSLEMATEDARRTTDASTATDDGRRTTDGNTPTSVVRRPSPVELRQWPLSDQLVIQAKEQRGAGSLELLDSGGRLAQWRYTPARAKAAHRLVDRFRIQQSGQPAEGNGAEPAESVCPSCGAVIQGEQGFCAACAAAPIARPARTLLRLVRFARRRSGMAMLGMALAVASTAAGMIAPYLVRPLFDNVVTPYQLGQEVPLALVVAYLAGLAGAAVLTWLLSWGRTDLIARISTDTDRICYFLSIYFLDFANDVLMILMTAVVLLLINFELALAALVPLPLIGWLVHRVRNRLRGGFQSGTRAWAEMTSVLADTIPGIRVVKAFAQEHREIERFGRSNQRVLQANDRVNRLWAFFVPVISLLTESGSLIIWVVAVWQVYHHRVSVGVLIMFFAYITRFYGRLDSMSRFVAAVQRAAASAQRVFSIMDREATVPEPVNPVQPGRLHGRIEFRDVGFRYGTRAILDGVNLTIEPGEMIGLVGPSGAGKTTLVNLVCRFYDVADGAILVDGTDLRSFAIEQYRRHVGLVLQEPFLFYGTIAENIAYGRPEAESAEIVAAAKAARAHEFILRLSDGYDSLVGERGGSLSGGERQRISIARALLIDPRILILDEATSSVDTETEREIQLALENLIRGRTTIAIAHRLSTLRRADRLVVIERGRITEVGPHQQLLDSGRTYARLYRAQSETPEGRSR